MSDHARQINQEISKARRLAALMGTEAGATYLRAFGWSEATIAYLFGA